jgi:hypothetical protein
MEAIRIDAARRRLEESTDCIETIAAPDRSRCAVLSSGASASIAGRQYF